MVKHQNMRYNVNIKCGEGEFVMENEKGKICPNCGEVLPGDSSFCVKCGTKIEDNQQSKLKKEIPKKKIGIIIGIVLLFVIVGFAINAIRISTLKKELMRDWQNIEGENGSYILCILDFSEDEIKYRIETGYSWMNMTIGTYEYKVINGNTIKVKQYGEWENITVKFNDDKTMMTLTPALTSVDDEEEWFNLD